MVNHLLNGYPKHLNYPSIFAGVELTGYLNNNKDLNLRKVLFLPAQGRLITLSSGSLEPVNVLHFWEVEDTKIEKVN